MSFKKTLDRIKISAKLPINDPEEAGKALTAITLLSSKEREMAGDAVNKGKEVMMDANSALRDNEDVISEIIHNLKYFSDAKLNLMNSKPQSISLPEGSFGYRKDRDRWQFGKGVDFKANLKETTLLEEYEKESLFEEELVEVVKVTINKAEVKKLAERPDAEKLFAALGVVYIKGEKQFFVERDNLKKIQAYRDLMAQFETGE